MTLPAEPNQTRIPAPARNAPAPAKDGDRAPVTPPRFTDWAAI